MLWVILMGGLILGVFAWSWMDKATRRLAERQVAATDPEGYRLAMEYKESQKPENLAKAAALLEQQRREAKALLTTSLTAVDDAPIVLKAGETAYWVEQCRYYEDRSLRDLGIERTMLEVDAGPLVLTDKRIIFVGAKRTIELPLTKVVSIQQLDGSMQVNVANGKSRRLGTGNPRAEVIAVRLLEGNARGAGNGKSKTAEVAVNDVSVNLSQSFNGPRELIVQTLDNVAALLQSEVDSRASMFTKQIVAKPVDASTFLTTISDQSQSLAEMFAYAEQAFVIAGSPKGSPGMLGAAFGDVLDHLLGVRKILRKMDAPAMFAKTDAAYRDYVDSFYRQIAGWPKQVQKAAGEVKGDSYELDLSATYNIAPLERALSVESPA